MELCTTAARAISNSSILPHHKPFLSNQSHVRWTSFISLKHSYSSRSSPGSLYTKCSLKSRASVETSSGATQYVEEETDGLETFNDFESAEKSECEENEVVKEDTPIEHQTQPLEFLNKLNIEI